MVNSKHTNTFHSSVLFIIVSFNNAENVLRIINSLNTNETLSRSKIEFSIVLNKKNIDIHEIDYLKGIKNLDIEYLPESFFWAKSIKFLINKNKKNSFDFIAHINDDVSSIDLNQIDFFKLLNDKKNIICGEFYDENDNKIFGKRIFSGYRIKISQQSADMFNGNFFIAPKKLIEKCLPSYTFSHAFLDYVISYRLLKQNKSYLKTIDFVTKVESQEDRKKHYLPKKQIRNSRLNPIDAAIFYAYILKFHLILPVFFYCLFKSVVLLIKKNFN